MYVPKHFQEDRLELLRGIREANPFATVVAQTSNGLITVTRTVGKPKLKQNRSSEDQLGVIQGLESDADPEGAALARLMREHAQQKQIQSEQSL